jgi:hypothetical protein
MSIDELIKELFDKINRILSLYFLKTEGKTEIVVEEKRPEEKAYETPCDRELSEFREKCIAVNGGVITYEAYESLKTKANTIIHYDQNICGTRYLCVSYVYEKEYIPEKGGVVVVEEKPKVETEREKKPCHLRGGYPWDWISEGVNGYMDCLDQVLGAFPDSRLACGVLVYLYKNNMISEYKCHRYCVNCNDICFGWASELISGEKISGYCDDQGNCYANGVLVYPFDKEYVKSTNDQILISALRQLGCW